MAFGDVTNTVVSGGGPPAGGASRAVRTVLLFGVSPAGTPATLYSPSSQAAVKSALDIAVLGEACAKLLEHGAQQVYACPLTPSTAGGVGSVTQVGTGAGSVTPSCAPHKAITVKCTTSGAIATMKVRFSLDGGTTYGPITDSADSGGGSWVYRVPGTFCTLTFAAASYVATKTLTVAVDGTVTPGSAWVGTVTQASSPLDNYDVVLTVVKAGALGTATIQPSLDGGKSTLPTMLVPSGGVVVLPGTGLVLTLSSTFVAGETYAFLCVPPGFSTSDVNTAMAAMAASSDAPTVALAYVHGLPASAAGAISLASAIQTQINTAASSYGKQWYGMCDCPSSVAADTIVSSGTAIVDSADTDAVIRAARVTYDFPRVAVCVGTNRMPSSVGSTQIRRPTGLAVAARMVEDDPSNNPALVGRGKLDVTVIGRDDWTAGTTLHDAQFTVLRTMPNRPGAYIAIEAGGFGWRNMTTDPNYQDANAVRVLCAFLIAITTAGQKYLGASDIATKADGTIAEQPRQSISRDLDGVAKRSTGLLVGGDFTKPQASSASASVLTSSQLGQSPNRLDVQYVLQRLGFVSQVNDNVFFSGVLQVAA